MHGEHRQATVTISYVEKQFAFQNSDVTWYPFWRHETAGNKDYLVRNFISSNHALENPARSNLPRLLCLCMIPVILLHQLRHSRRKYQVKPCGGLLLKGTLSMTILFKKLLSLLTSSRSRLDRSLLHERSSFSALKKKTKENTVAQRF